MAPVPSRPAATRPRTRRGLRRRPTPILRPDPAASPTAVADHVRRLCELVLRFNDIDSLADFAAGYDPRGARTFPCLLYTLDRYESALYWWRFAAGGEDPLAAHLLAAHHAAVGVSPDARLWRAQARMLGFSHDSHLPRSVRPGTHLAEGFARTVPWGKCADHLHQDRAPAQRTGNPLNRRQAHAHSSGGTAGPARVDARTERNHPVRNRPNRAGVGPAAMRGTSQAPPLTSGPRPIVPSRAVRPGA